MHSLLRTMKLVVGCGVALTFATELSAQTPTGKTSAKAKANPGAGGVRTLDARVIDLQRQLLKDANEISKGYEDAGEYDRAKWMLEVLHKLDPKLPGLKERIDQLTEKSLDSTEFEVELDVSKGWTPPIAIMPKDRLVRLEASGDYKLSISATATGDGLPTKDDGSELLPGMPIGAIVGIVNNTETKKLGKPFEVKGKREWMSKEPGYLQLKVNLPAGHTSKGKLKVQVSGAARAPS